jgi:hypothetical protein
MDDPGTRRSVTDEVRRSRVVDHAWTILRGLDPQAPDEPSADRGMIGLHAGVDDRNRHAETFAVAKDRRPVQHPERAVTKEAGSGLPRESL